MYSNFIFRFLLVHFIINCWTDYLVIIIGTEVKFCNFISYVVSESCSGCLETALLSSFTARFCSGLQAYVRLYTCPDARSKRGDRVESSGSASNHSRLCEKDVTALADLSLQREFSYGRDIDIVALALG